MLPLNVMLDTEASMDVKLPENFSEKIFGRKMMVDRLANATRPDVLTTKRRRRQVNTIPTTRGRRRLTSLCREASIFA